MVLSKTAKCALIGLAGYVSGVLWMAIHEHLEKLTDPPGWIVDRELYLPAQALAALGGLLFVTCILIISIRAVYRQISN